MFLKLLLAWTVVMLLFTLYVYFDGMHTHDQMFGVFGAIALYLIGLPFVFIVWFIFFRKSQCR